MYVYVYHHMRCDAEADEPSQYNIIISARGFWRKTTNGGDKRVYCV